MLRNVALKVLRDQRKGLLAWGLGFVAVVLMYASIYPSIRENAETLTQYVENLPEAIRGFLGEAADFVSPEGYLQAELFSFVVPLMLLIYAIGAGARATAGEEEARTLDMLLSTPIRRRRVVADKFLAMISGAGGLTLVLWLSLVLLGPLWDLELDVGNAAAASAASFLLAVAFGSVALAIGCAGGRKGLAISVTSALGFATYIVNALAPSVEALEPFQRLSPFYYYAGETPLVNGLAASDVLVLVGIAAAFFLLSLVTFERRDLAV